MQTVHYGQIVLGPPGSGKSTYCDGMRQFCEAIGRTCININLDPANVEISYPCEINIRNLITLEFVMEEYNLGPNGGVVFCMDYLFENVDWLDRQIKQYSDSYLLVDLPGQVELYTHHSALLKTFKKLEKLCGARFVMVYLVDSVLCTDASKYISALLVALSSHIMLELPYISCLTKTDILKEIHADLAFRLDYYTQVQDLEQLLLYMDENSVDKNDALTIKYHKFQASICELVQDFNLASFYPLNINSKIDVLRVLLKADEANGLSFGDESKFDPKCILKKATASFIKDLELHTLEYEENFSEDSL